MLDLVGIGELGHKYPAQMSGGQQQRVALARALAIEPSILLLDEPLSALDARVRERLRQEIRRLQERLGVTTIMVTHDQEEALTMADRIIVMNEGRLIQYATPQEVYHDPMDAFVADFVGTMNFMKRWHVNGNDTVTFGGVSLQTAKHISRILTGEDVTLAIRPEDVRILKRNDSDTNTLQATVEGVEFRGSFYRVRFRIQAEGDYSGAPFLEADLQSSIVRQLGVRQGVSLSVQLPPDRLHFFPEKTQHPYNCA
jgi:iron(III) transport system ATP-binding protein